jgi:hypothetical protein
MQPTTTAEESSIATTTSIKTAIMTMVTTSTEEFSSQTNTTVIATTLMISPSSILTTYIVSTTTPSTTTTKTTITTGSIPTIIPISTPTITASPNMDTSSDEEVSRFLNLGATFGVVIGALAFVVLVVGFIYYSVIYKNAKKQIKPVEEAKVTEAV